MQTNDYFIQSEVAYRTERLRRSFGKGRRNGARRNRRWQGPLRGAEEMR